MCVSGSVHAYVLVTKIFNDHNLGSESFSVPEKNMRQSTSGILD